MSKTISFGSFMLSNDLLLTPTLSTTPGLPLEQHYGCFLFHRWGYLSNTFSLTV